MRHLSPLLRWLHRARSAIEARVAQVVGMSTAEAAWGAYLIAASSMINAIKGVSSERGRDPREYALVAFGGNGPLFAVAMAQALQIRRVLIPPSAGVFSSYGLLYSEVAYQFTRSRKALLGAVDPGEIDGILREPETHAQPALAEDGFAQEQIALERVAALHYQGQSFELEVPVAPGAIDRAMLVALEEVYGVEHEKTYGHRADADEPVELVTLKVVGRGVPEIPARRLPPRPGCWKMLSWRSRCGAPISDRPAAGATLLSSTAPISGSPGQDPASLRCDGSDRLNHCCKK